MSVGALAEETIQGGTGEGSNETTVTYKLDQNWIITIPPSITLSEAGTSDDQVVAITNAHINAGNELVIKATSSNNGTLNFNQATIKYQLNGHDLSNAEETKIGSMANTENQSDIQLHFSATVAKVAAGTYTDTITFSAASETVGE